MSGTAADPPDPPGSDDAEAGAIEPTNIDVDRREGLTLTWADGQVAHLRLLELRANCPCAECRERRRRGDPIWPRAGSPEPLLLLDARLVGAFGIGFDWNDGHSTGIYTWDALRRWSSG